WNTHESSFPCLRLHLDFATLFPLRYRDRDLEHAIAEGGHHLALVGPFRQRDGAVKGAVADLAPDESFPLFPVLLPPLPRDCQPAPVDRDIDVLRLETRQAGSHPPAAPPLA